jgi:hypothetical protein
MINIPSYIESYYQIEFHDCGAECFAMHFGLDGSEYIEDVLLTSDEINSEIYAHNEISDGVAKILADLGPYTVETKFNPVYHPMPKDELSELIQLGDEGKIIEIGGFTNPFVFTETDWKMKDVSQVSAEIYFPPFELPSFNELIKEVKHS